MPAHPHQCDPVSCPASVQVLDHRVGAVEGAVHKIADAMDRFAKTTEQLARLEERHVETRQAMERAFGEIGKLDVRTDAIEARLPPLEETRSWVVRGLIGVMCVVGMAVLKLVVAGA